MAWVETESLSFTARHETDDEACAQRTLDRLEDLRLRLEDRFDDAPGGITVIVHPSPGLARRRPPVPAGARLAAAPAGRRYLAGWAMASELHILNDEYTDRRAAGEDSLAALRGTAERLYAQIVIAANNDRLPPPWGPRRFRRYVRWAWLIEGGAQYFAGQTALFRAAVNTRMRQGKPPAFPPTARDAIILGGTIFDLLERERGPDACDGPRLAAAPRGRRSGRSSSPSTRASARSRASGGATCATSCRARARSTSSLDEDPFASGSPRRQAAVRRAG